SYIGRLPNLEVLKLRCYAFRGPEWETIEGEIFRLRFLMLEDMDIEHWRADETNFPWLTRLIFRHCYKLREIPCGIGEIPTLEMIELDDCSPSVVNSARQIQEEQKNVGNVGLQVWIHYSWDDKKLKS
ncbi:hypothetical protein Pfo_011074, partial [Paulownia fortunei]